LVPPSKVNGVRYTWLRKVSQGGTPLRWADVQALFSPPVPAGAPSTGVHSLADRRTGQTSSSVRVASLVRHVLHLQEGERNNGFYWAVCRAVEKGHSDLSALQDAGLRIGLTPHEVDSSIASARKTAQAKR
jgi:hypothetical protein